MNASTSEGLNRTSLPRRTAGRVPLAAQAYTDLGEQASMRATASGVRSG